MSVTASFWCWIAGIVSSLVGLLLMLSSPIWAQALAYAARSNPGVEVTGLLNTLKIIFVVIFLVVAGLYLFFALKMLGGRNWARITLTVVGALSALSALTPFSSSVTVSNQTFAGNQAPSYITAILTVAGVVLMYVGGANRFFSDSVAYRRAQR
jgi:hypothetical protein